MKNVQHQILSKNVQWLLPPPPINRSPGYTHTHTHSPLSQQGDVQQWTRGPQETEFFAASVSNTSSLFQLFLQLPTSQLPRDNVSLLWLPDTPTLLDSVSSFSWALLCQTIEQLQHMRWTLLSSLITMMVQYSFRFISLLSTRAGILLLKTFCLKLSPTHVGFCDQPRFKFHQPGRAAELPTTHTVERKMFTFQMRENELVRNHSARSFLRGFPLSTNCLWNVKWKTTLNLRNQTTAAFHQR